MMIKIQGFKFYDVYLNEGEYLVVNKMTKVVEERGRNLPNILFQAEANNDTLQKFLTKDKDKQSD
ncbi:MAG: hypothetical protein ACRCTW_04485 [Lactococcus garvieae]